MKMRIFKKEVPLTKKQIVDSISARIEEKTYTTENDILGIWRNPLIGTAYVESKEKYVIFKMVFNNGKEKIEEVPIEDIHEIKNYFESFRFKRIE